ncbi:transposase [Runella aurantiaca]|uniref:Transposase n=1 Tax=Runella aurantiaca TaxID=2282308 RepID=A0A369I6M3_9BACT|nr:transposase [Runella aurantiaca]RDB05258.1 transposase [Runella aurantiaca]
MKTIKLIAIFLSLAVLTWNCASKDAEEEAKEEPKNGLEALQKLGEEAERMSKEGPKETVDPKLLKELLPADADGLKRKEASSEKSAAMGFGVSTAKASYRDDNGQDIDVNITDVAGMGVALMGMAAWSMASIDKETETGYEKTTEYKGHKAFEKYNTQSKNGEISVIVANRYIVQVEGRDVDMDKIKSVLDDIDLDKLADIK